MNPADRKRLVEQARQQLLFLQESGVNELDLGAFPALRTGTQAVPAPTMVPAAPPRGAQPVPAPAKTPKREGDPASLLEHLRVSEIGDCRRCKLCEGRNTIVFGDGNPRARVMFVGEGPGFEEDRRGLPFVGKAGQLLNQIIEAMGFKREEVYIANVVKCRPPDNRTPQPDEVDACTPFLFEQIDIIRPDVIVALGSPAAQALLGRTAGITKIRGTFSEYKGIRVMPTFHPAYLLRNPAAKRPVWEDMKQVMAFLRS